MVTAQEIVDRAGLSPPGDKQLLWEDPEHTVLHSKFRQTGNLDFDRQWFVFWWMKLYRGDKTKIEQEIFSSFWMGGGVFEFAYPSSYSSNHTGQKIITICAYRDQTTQAHLDELELWLPHIEYAPPVSYYDRTKKSVGEGDWFQHLEIFDHTLGADGPYWLKKERSGHLVILNGRFDRNHFDSLYSAVDFIRTRHWYQKRLK
jgi:hypothetical protein